MKQILFSECIPNFLPYECFAMHMMTCQIFSIRSKHQRCYSYTHRVRSRAPTDKSKKTPDDSTQITRGLEGHTHWVCSRAPADKTRNPPNDSTRITRGLRGSYWVQKLGFPNGPASQQKLSPADGITNDAQLLGQPRYLTTVQKSDPVSDRKVWPRRGRLSLSTPTRFSDRKAWLRRGRRSLPTSTRFSDRE